jgi:GTPase SAR1 family protein
MTNDKTGAYIWKAIKEIAQQTEMIFHQLEIFPGWDGQRRIQSIQLVLERAHRSFKFGILGEFNAGKSSLINVLANREIALIDEMEVTAVLCRYGYADMEEAIIRFSDGRELRMSVTEVNRLLGQNRHDVVWLQQIQEVWFQSPCDNLQRIELWDTPGFAGSTFNEQLARRFVAEVDAAIWVFDANYIGGSHIADVISELRDRGKHIIVVVNKCEEWTEKEMGGVASTLKASYPPLRQSAIILFSARMARAFQKKEETDYFGDLPEDGGLQALSDCLEQEILQDPTYLSATAAAGDLRAMIGSAEDWLQRERAIIDRLMWLINRQDEEIKQRVGPRLQRLASELRADMEPALQDHLLQQIRKKLYGASVSELQDDHWIIKQLDASWNIHEVQVACVAFARGQSSRITAVLEQLGLDQKACMIELLTPLERHRLLTSAPTSDGEDYTSLESKRGAIAHGDMKSAAIGASALVGIAALIAFPIPTAIFATGVAFGKYILHRDTRTLSPQQWRDHRWNQCHIAIRDRLQDLMPDANRWLSAEMKRIESDATALILQERRNELLRGEDLDRLHELHLSFTQAGNDLKALGTCLEQVAGLNERIGIQPGRLLLPSADLEKREELLKSIFNQARFGFSMTDGDLDYVALKKLLELPAETPIRIVTWKQPLSLGVSGLFAEQVNKLRELRHGEVTVAVVQRSDHDSTTDATSTDIRPTGCWVFTDTGAYHFDTSFNELLRGGQEYSFTSQDETAKHLEEQFLRWWENRVEGYRTIYLI